MRTHPISNYFNFSPSFTTQFIHVIIIPLSSRSSNNFFTLIKLSKLKHAKLMHSMVYILKFENFSGKIPHFVIIIKSEVSNCCSPLKKHCLIGFKIIASKTSQHHVLSEHHFTACWMFALSRLHKVFVYTLVLIITNLTSLLAQFSFAYTNRWPHHDTKWYCQTSEAEKRSALNWFFFCVDVIRKIWIFWQFWMDESELKLD